MDGVLWRKGHLSVETTKSWHVPRLLAGRFPMGTKHLLTLTLWNYLGLVLSLKIKEV